MVSSKQFFPTEKHKYEKVVLPRSYLLKNAKCYETRCNTANSINFQSGHAPQSFIILFSM